LALEVSQKAHHQIRSWQWGLLPRQLLLFDNVEIRQQGGGAVHHDRGEKLKT